MLVLSKSLRLLLVFSQLWFVGEVGYAAPKPSSRVACVIESKEAEISITLEDRSAYKKKILGQASVELKEGHFSNLKAEKSKTCVFSSVSHEPGLEEIISIKYGEGVSFLLKPNHELELIKLQMPQSDLEIIAPFSKFILANETHLKARSLTVKAKEATNRAAVKIQELRIERGDLKNCDLKNYGQIESLKENLSILMNGNSLLNMKSGGIHSKSNLSVFGVSTLTNEGIIKTYKKGLLHIEVREFCDKGTIYYADINCMNIVPKEIKIEDVQIVSPIEKRKRNDSGFESANDSGIGSGSDSERSRTSSFSSVWSDDEHAEILSWSDYASEPCSEAEEDQEESNLRPPEQMIPAEPIVKHIFRPFKLRHFISLLFEDSEFFQEFPHAMGEELVSGKPLAHLPRRAMSRTSHTQPSPRGSGRPFMKTSPRFNVFRGPIKNAQHKVSSTTARTPSLPELRGGSEKAAPSPGFEDKLASLDSMSSLRDGASKNPISKSFETPEEQKIISSKLDNLLIHALKVLNTAGRKFSEIFFRKGPVYKFSMILWENFLTFKPWFLLCAICGLLLFGVRKVLLFFKDALEADV
ncbi:MAG: hypothetical protein ACRCYP_02680 [Alphaproteobacteria bacterium]